MSTHFSSQSIFSKQKNHEGFYIPQCIRHLGSMPLYRAVALWGLCLGREFTRDDISDAFRIEPRRASGILNYICNRYPNNDILFDSRLRTMRGGRTQLVIHVRYVESRQNSFSRRQLASSRGKGKDPKQDRLMARWLLTRPSGGDAAKLAAWQATCPVQEGSC